MGSKRKHDRPRTANGRLSRASNGPARDQGTAELQVKRLALVNGRGDPALSATPAGILFAHGHLSRDQLAAAERYGALHRMVFGAVWFQACLLGREQGDDMPVDDDELERRERRLNDMAALLSPEQKRQIDNLVISGWIPAWFFARRTPAEGAALLSGLARLARA